MRQKIKRIPEPRLSHRGRLQKNYVWLVFFIVLFWVTTAFLIFSFEPEGRIVWLALASLFMALFLSLSLLFLSARSGLWWSSGVVLFLYMRLWGFGGVVNFFLILGVLSSVEIYFRQRKNADLQK